MELDLKSGLDNPDISQREEILKKEVIQRDLRLFFVPYYRGDGASVDDVSLADKIHFYNPDTGHFDVHVKVVYTDSCLVTSNEVNDRMTVGFVFDTARKKVMLTGPYWPDRDPHDI